VPIANSAPEPNTTLADSFTLLLFADLFSAHRAKRRKNPKEAVRIFRAAKIGANGAAGRRRSSRKLRQCLQPGGAKPFQLLSGI